MNASARVTRSAIKVWSPGFSRWRSRSARGAWKFTVASQLKRSWTRSRHGNSEAPLLSSNPPAEAGPPNWGIRPLAARHDSDDFEMIAGLKLQRRKFRRRDSLAVMLDY